MAWEPLLAGAEREAALGVVRNILDAVSREPVENPSLAGGSAGTALLFAYAEQAGLGGDDLNCGEKADELLGHAVDAVATHPLDGSLYSGFTGIAWTADHMTGGSIGEGDEDPNAEIDVALAEHLSQTPWFLDYDLIGGLCGHGVYALERARVPSGRQVLERVIDRLVDTAIPEEGQPGLTWLTGPHLMIPSTRELNPQGYLNTGLAHGMPACVVILACAAAAGVAEEKARPLLDAAMAWLGAQRGVNPDGSAFPYTVSVPRVADRHQVRAAWCYGDPGVAAAILLAARAVGHAGWETMAMEVGRQTAARPVDKCGVLDAGLCHGAAGLAHIYNRMYRASGDAVFADAARRWTDKLLAMQVPDGLAGYLAWVPKGPNHELGWGKDATLLTGITGIALALLGLATEHEPRWDRMLMTNVPPR